MAARTILIVEDDESIRKLAGANLAARGYDVKKAMTAADCYEVLNTVTPALILLDLKLPDNDGTVLLEQFTQVGQWSHIPVIVMTASVTDARDVMARNLPNVRAVIVKPFQVTELIDMTGALLNG